jgi:hypothetical protein
MPVEPACPKVEIIYVHGRDVTKQQDAGVDNRKIQFPEMIHGLRNGCFDSSWIRAINIPSAQIMEMPRSAAISASGSWRLHRR